jgi:hypothetical protein
MEGHYWVVTCKNTKHHSEENPLHGHRVPIGRTDAHSPRPAIPDYLDIQCDYRRCGRTYAYTAPEIIRWYGDMALLVSHPLFGWPTPGR